MPSEMIVDESPMSVATQMTPHAADSATAFGNPSPLSEVSVVILQATINLSGSFREPSQRICLSRPRSKAFFFMSDSNCEYPSDVAPAQMNLTSGTRSTRILAAFMNVL